jgi:hypothetical protein
MSDHDTPAPEVGFSPVEDPILRAQRTLKVVPRDGLAAARRAVFLAFVTWLPIMAWAVATGRLHLWGGDSFLEAALLLHVRCLIAIPLFVLAEPLAHRIVSLIAANFVHAQLVRPADRQRYLDMVRSVERWRDSGLAWLGIAGLMVLSTLTTVGLQKDPDALGWSVTPGDFGSSWYQWVVRPIFLFLLCTWLFRLWLTGLLLYRTAKLGVDLVPAHPDRVGGLGFADRLPAAFSLVIFAISSVVSASLAHEILAHGAHLAELRLQMLSFAVLLAVLFLLPLSVFSGALRRMRNRALFDYGTLAGRHVRGLHQRWVLHRPVEDDVLSAPELGPAADIATLYELATRVRVLPISKLTLVTVLVPALLPMLFVVTLEVPLRDILLKVLGALS